MAKRIYHVTSRRGAVTQHQLIRAHTPGSAVQHAAKGAYNAETASQDTLVQLLAKGHKVEDVGVEQADIEDEVHNQEGDDGESATA